MAVGALEGSSSFTAAPTAPVLASPGRPSEGRHTHATPGKASQRRSQTARAGDSTSIWWDGNSATGFVDAALVQFTDIIGLGPNQLRPHEDIVQATLRYHVEDGGDPAELHEVDVPWSGATTTWSSFVGAAGMNSQDLMTKSGSAEQMIFRLNPQSGLATGGEAAGLFLRNNPGNVRPVDAVFSVRSGALYVTSDTSGEMTRTHPLSCRSAGT